MYPLITMAIALTFLVILLRLKFRIGRAMVLAAVLLGLLLWVTPAQLCHTLADEWHSRPFTQTTGYQFLTLTGLIILVNALGAAMDATGVSQRLAPALHGLFRSRRLALAAIPAMMGMLPTPGGIMLSAPLVRQPGDDIGIDRARLAAINYWFRHQWEPVWPLFPAIPYIQSLLGVSALSLIAHNLPLTAAGFLSGTVFLLLKGIPPKDHSQTPHRRIFRHLAHFLHAFWPIALTIALYTAFNLPPALGILIALAGFFLAHQVPLRRAVGIIKSSAEPDFALVILGSLLFNLNLSADDAVPQLARFLTDIHIPVPLLIFLLPFLVASLTGVTFATVAITFPFLLGFIGTGPDADLSRQTLAFAGLLCGLLATPVHLCLALSTSYFQTTFAKILLHLLFPLALTAASATLLNLLS